ncbi:hypothetical protein CSB45_10590 [candidate division KSB3 bacterium]|uniref:Uncharacterized protein n=1 Tax=candidate division KSB3 bacterium TaxID=2044937 RepID=A0A2G6E421_9BACT|nr:MAG: hypothetical protein CSB45_10590 [candidate division KSB3 bacterium]PIE29139.1 MAG: hypothetical protein CSA57_10035 [candidate division KSB3 bacterium]
MKLKTLFSGLLKGSHSLGRHRSLERRSPVELSTKFDIFQYLDFNIPELQPVKLSLDFEKYEKAFEQFFQYLKIRTSPAFLCRWWKREEIVECLRHGYAAEESFILEAKDRILAHRFQLFGAHDIQADSRILWNRSHETGRSADTELWPSGVQYRAEDLETDDRQDVHFIWELNRHVHFLDLGKAYWYTGDEACAREFVEEVLGWIEQNPYLLSVNWTNPHEIALRGIFWIFGYNFFVRSEYVDEAFLCAFYQALLEHGHAVHSVLQQPDSSCPKHSLTAQASFLYLLGTMFPEYLHSKAWARVGWDLLQWKTPQLLPEDLKQDCVASLVSIIEFYLIVLLVRKHNRYHVPPVVFENLQELMELLSAFVKPDGSLSRFGSVWPNYMLAGMFPSRPGKAEYLFSLAAVLLKSPTLAYLGRRIDPAQLCFLGKDELQDFENLPREAPGKNSSLVANSSFAMMRDGWEPDSSYCLVSMAPSSVHQSSLAHSDLLSFELVIRGHDYLQDSGPYSCQKDEWNEFFRSMWAHNSITVDRIKHLPFQQKFLTTSCDIWTSTPRFDLLSASHSGFEELDEAIAHRRAIFYYKPDYWILCDLLTGEGRHFFDQYFHFPSFRLHVDFTNKCVSVKVDEREHFVLMPFNANELDVSIFTGGESPDSGWISQGYKWAVEAPFIRYGKKSIAPNSFHTLIHSYAHDTALTFSGRLLQVEADGKRLLSHEVSALEICHEQKTDYFVLVHEMKYESVQIERFSYSGRMFFLRQEGDALQELLLFQCSLLKIAGKVVFQSTTPVEYLRLRFEGESLYAECEENYTFRMEYPAISQVFVNNRQASLQYDAEMRIISTARL